MNVEVITIPEKTESIEESLKIKKLVEDRNPIIAKRFMMEPSNIKVKLYRSKGQLVSSLDPNGESMGVFGGYPDGSDSILLMHPENVAPIFGDNLSKEMSILADYALTKFYLCKKYYPDRTQFKLYYKYVSEGLAQVSAGNLKEGIVKFDIKTFFEGKRYKKDQELVMVFYIMLKNSGLDFIYSHLDEMMGECDIKKTVFAIYKKTFSDLVMQVQREILDEEKKLQKVFKPGRR